jgi:hypothetical protein
VTLETAASRARLRCFLAVEEAEGATDDTPVIDGIDLTHGDLRGVLADCDDLAAAIERTTTKMRDYADHGIERVNLRQVINLLSLTWPDGNYEAPDATRHVPLTDEPCGHTTTPAGTRAVNAYRAHRTQQHPHGGDR